MTKDQKNNRKKLVDALRDEKYTQVIGFLRGDRPNCFCVAGLACEISGLGEWIDNDFVINKENYSFATPKLVVQHYGFSPAEFGMLVEMNDNYYNYCFSFPELADIIENDEISKAYELLTDK